MKYVEFKNGLENGQTFSAYLFEGEDAFFRERGLNLLKSKFVSNPELNFTVLEPDCENDELISSLSAYPFMSEKRLVVIREYYPKQDALKKGLTKYMESPADFSVLAIINEKPCEPLKKISGINFVDCNRADASVLVRWIKAECSNNGVNIQAETAKQIADYCLSDMTRIENETKKLCSYIGSGGEITAQAVDLMVARDTEYKVYEMTDYIAKKKFDLALTVIKDMMGKGETPQRILTAVYNYYRRLLHSAISDMEVTELAQVFGIKEFAAKKTKEQASLFKKRALKSAVDALTDADFKIKSGLIDADEVTWITIFKIMTDK